MPGAMLPPGYRAFLLGQYPNLGETAQFEVLEQGLPEGTRLLAKLMFQSFPSREELGKLNQNLKSQGVVPWPEFQDLVFAHPSEPACYIAWTKGSPFWGWILGGLAALVLPPLIGALIWWVLPQEFRQLIMLMIVLPVMMLMMNMMTRSLAKPKPKTEEKEG